MGLNLVIGCHRCKQKVWTLRGEGDPLYSFALDHWAHWDSVELTHDQTDRDWHWDDPTYINMSCWYGVWDEYAKSYPRRVAA